MVLTPYISHGQMYDLWVLKFYDTHIAHFIIISIRSMVSIFYFINIFCFLSRGSLVIVQKVTLSVFFGNNFFIVLEGLIA